jgi:hypothetical protein
VPELLKFTISDSIEPICHRLLTDSDSNLQYRILLLTLLIPHFFPSTMPSNTPQLLKLTLYYLAQSRSHRILWLLNELSIPCTLIYSARGPNGACVNPAFATAHPLGTAPILEIQYPYLDHAIVLSESALIIDFLCENAPHGRKMLPAKYRPGQERAGMEMDAWKRNKFYFAWGEESLLSFIAVAFARDCSSSLLEKSSL